MREVKQINIKNRSYYFYNDIINLKKFDAELLKIDKKSYKNIGIYYIGYITKKKIDDCEKITSVNPLYLSIDDDNLPLNKPLKFRLMTITIRSVFSESGKFYPQLFYTILCMH